MGFPISVRHIKAKFIKIELVLTIFILAITLNLKICH